MRRRMDARGPIRSVLHAFLAAALTVGVAAGAVAVDPAARRSGTGEATTGGAGSITLVASRPVVRHGQVVRLSGEVTPPLAAQPVVIVEADTGRTVAEAATDERGHFAVEVGPERNVAFQARWGEATSVPVDVRVRGLVGVRLSGVRLFDDAAISGRVSPAHPGAPVRVSLFRDGARVLARTLMLRDDGRFRTRLRLLQPGTYRARASFRDADHARGSDRSARIATPLPRLVSGSRGVFVRLLERRLAELRYRLAGVDPAFDHRTADAVMAFRKVQGMERLREVDAGTWRALASPAVPSARGTGAGFHVEVDQTRQVLYTVRDGRVTNILHVSTGANGATRDGSFRVYRKLAGYSPNRLYYPSYFDGLRAIHGWPDVPPYPASHGCVRVPYWNAIWIHDRVPIGTEVLIYH